MNTFCHATALDAGHWRSDWIPKTLHQCSLFPSISQEHIAYPCHGVHCKDLSAFICSFFFTLLYLLCWAEEVPWSSNVHRCCMLSKRVLQRVSSTSDSSHLF